MEKQLTLTAAAAKQVRFLQNKQGNPGLMLRLSVLGGGCSGFQYKFEFATDLNADDHYFEHDGVKLVTDSASLDILNGSTVDYVTELLGASFQVKNPNAQSGCGCGVSFALKDDFIP